MYIFTSSGECVGHIVSSNINVGLDNPAGVTVDEDGFVYVCGYYSNNVVIIYCLLLSYLQCVIIFC